MLEINFAHVCESAYFLENKTPAIIGIFSRIFTKELPLVIPRVTIIVEFIPSDKEIYNIEIQFISPSNKVITSFKSSIGPPEEGDERLGIVTDLSNIKLEEEGKYQVKILSADKELKTIPIEVRKQNSL